MPKTASGLQNNEVHLLIPPNGKIHLKLSLLGVKTIPRWQHENSRENESKRNTQTTAFNYDKALQEYACQWAGTSRTCAVCCIYRMQRDLKMMELKTH